MRIATWNVNSLKARMPRVEEWLEYAKPDILCMQETKLSDDAFPAMDFSRLGYEWAHHGEGRWNGVAILSKFGITDVVTGFNDGLDDERAEARAITATCGDIRVTSIYVPNGRSLDDDMYQWKLQWLERLRGFLETHANTEDGLLVAGDFNIAPADIDVYSPAAFVGQTHVSDDERKRLQSIIDWGMHDVFREHYPDTKNLYTWWDYRAGNFHKGLGMRIDLMLMTKPLAKSIKFALVDRNARKGKLPSDHAPLFVDL